MPAKVDFQMLRSLAEFSAHRTFDSDSDDNSDNYSDSEDSLLLPHNIEDPLYARILPQQQLDIPYIPPEMRPVRDSVFAVLYCCSMLVMLILGAIHVFSNAAPEAGGFASQIYSAITRNIGIKVSKDIGLLTGLTAASMLLAALWLLFLSYFAVAVISTISIILPMAMISLSIVSLVTAVQNIGYGEYKFMSVFSIFGIISSTFVSFLLWKNRNLVLTHAKIVSLACDILKINPSLFVLSALLTLGHIIFTVIWMYMFCQVLAHDSSNETYIPLFFVGMYFWTSSLVQNLERVTVSSVVGEWYFLRFEKNIKGDMTWFHFRNISYTSFGTVVFASLILGFIRFMKFVIGITRRKSGNSLIVAVIEYVNQIIDRFSTYSLSYAGITGESYSQAAYLSTRYIT